MGKILNTLIIIGLLFTSCKRESPTVQNSNNNSEKAITTLLDFFDTHAYQAEQETYYSEIDNEGKVISGKVFNVALSRLIYGLSHASFIDSSYLTKAQKVADFQINKLVAADSISTYFISHFDLATNTPDSSQSLDIWQQAYGLCGLSELYRNHPNERLLAQIHTFHDDFVARFHDDTHGGFYGNYENYEKVKGSKSLQSLIYPITAYMENIWLADTSNRDKYEPYLKENIRIAYENGWNKDLGWVNVKFDDTWNPCEHESPEATCFNVTPGHNFQYASIFLRAQNWDFLTSEEQQAYKKFGMEVLHTTLNKPIFPKKDLSQGFYSEVNPVTNDIIDKRKTWWQHCEALVALSLAGDKFQLDLNNLKQFYFEAFPDKEHGGEFFFLDENNVPKVDELKGSIGKSGYHTIEMIRFLNNK